FQLPMQVALYASRDAVRTVHRAASEVEVVYCNHIRTAQWVPEIDVETVMDFHDAISLNYRQALREASGAWKMAYWWEHRRVLEYELACLRRFSRAFVCSPLDRDYLLQQFGNRDASIQQPPIGLVPMGVDDRLLAAPSSQPPEDNDVVFVGK